MRQMYCRLPACRKWRRERMFEAVAEIQSLEMGPASRGRSWRIVCDRLAAIVLYSVSFLSNAMLRTTESNSN